MSHRGGIGDYNGTTDPKKVPEGLIETRELLKKDICPREMFDFINTTETLDYSPIQASLLSATSLRTAKQKRCGTL